MLMQSGCSGSCPRAPHQPRGARMVAAMVVPSRQMLWTSSITSPAVKLSRPDGVWWQHAGCVNSISHTSASSAATTSLACAWR